MILHLFFLINFSYIYFYHLLKSEYYWILDNVNIILKNIIKILKINQDDLKYKLIQNNFLRYKFLEIIIF